MRIRYTLLVVVLLILSAVLATSADSIGTLEPDAPPDSTFSYTLENIYNRLASGTAGASSTFTEPTSGPTGGTMHTLNDIMSVAPQVDNTAGATQTHVLTGRTVWGLTSGQWGPITGTMPDNGAVMITPTTTNQTIATGYHNGAGYVTGDADLVAGNIKASVDLFGITGSVVEATGDATASDVLTDTTFSNAGEAGISGTMPDNGAVVITPTTTNQTIAAGYHNGSGYVTGDANLVASNIAQGVDIFGVTGSAGTNPAPVPKTGQAGCWDGAGGSVSCTGTGQDGEYQKGVAWPNPRFITGTAGIVTDTLTGLIWLENANCAPDPITWTLALSYSNALYDGCTDCFGTSGDCGLSDGSSPGDWRLPNVRELQSLVHYSFYDPALPNTAGTGQWTSGDPFTSVQLSYYWSSTTYANPTTYAWVVIMSYGRVGFYGKTSTNYVWPVRGGQ